MFGLIVGELALGVVIFLAASDRRKLLKGCGAFVRGKEGEASDVQEHAEEAKPPVDVPTPKMTAAVEGRAASSEVSPAPVVTHGKRGKKGKKAASTKDKRSSHEGESAPSEASPKPPSAAPPPSGPSAPSALASEASAKASKAPQPQTTDDGKEAEGEETTEVVNEGRGPDAAGGGSGGRCSWRTASWCRLLTGDIKITDHVFVFKHAPTEWVRRGLVNNAKPCVFGPGGSVLTVHTDRTEHPQAIYMYAPPGRTAKLSDGRNATALSCELRYYIAAKDTEAHEPPHPADTKKPSPQLAQLPTASTRDWRGASQEGIQEPLAGDAPPSAEPSQEEINRWFVEEYLPAQEAKEAEDDDKRWAEIEEKKAKQLYDHSQWAHFDEEWARVNNRQLWRQFKEWEAANPKMAPLVRTQRLRSQPSPPFNLMKEKESFTLDPKGHHHESKATNKAKASALSSVQCSYIATYILYELDGASPFHHVTANRCAC
ncbi:unnamed protein product [Vitrella brassicaformis CCMP3155]|uniref:Uncharacterized protein n=1 Tax=Vitrella brassicaformis (strain CCMP3155) TaxID=1169540 RepID=A0A0G4FWN8_VITBC|nr:unnamed protein product [Vitrella brassicaformis CCMP3155]|eukprot:CEM19633.1 unnamed protein product [Vitrella brassicaformis CCMP3155]